MNRSVDVVIIGAGIVGSSAAYHLAARGCTDVLVLEKADAPAMGSTAASAGGVRHLFEREVNIRLSKFSIQAMKDFHEEVGGHSGLRQTGYLFLASKPEDWAQFQEEAVLQRRMQVGVELLDPRDVPALVPGTRLDDLVGAVFGPEDGFCDPYGIASGYLNRARELGVKLALSTPVIGADVREDRILSIETPDGTISAGTVINASGAWSGMVAEHFGIDLPVRPYRRNAYLTEAFPLFPKPIPLTFDVSSGYWMRKEDERVLFGMVNPDEVPGVNLNVDWDWMPTVLEAGIQRFPLLEQARLAKKHCWAGLYEVTPDHMPILGRHPRVANYVNASGFSGHGVMHSPAAGMLTAEEVLDGRAHSIDIDELRITRFDERTLQSEGSIY